MTEAIPRLLQAYAIITSSSESCSMLWLCVFVLNEFLIVHCFRGNGEFLPFQGSSDNFLVGFLSLGRRSGQCYLSYNRKPCILLHRKAFGCIYLSYRCIV